MDLNNRGLYSLDLNDIGSLNLKTVDDLFVDLSIVSLKLNNLLQVNQDYYIKNSMKYSWMIERVNYFLETCSDCNKKLQVKQLYENYRSIRNRIVEANLKLVVDIAYQYKAINLVTYNDIIQYGNIGLMKAVEKYDINMGTRFSTYAYQWIVGSIGHNIRDIMHPTYIPEYVYRDYKKICLIQDNLMQLHGRNVTIKELSEETGFEIDYIGHVLNSFADAISINDTITLDKFNCELEVPDLIEDNDSDVSKNMIDNDTRLELLKFLKEQVTEGQYFILMKYFGFEYRSYNITEIAGMMKVTFQTVSDLKNRAIAKLRKKPKIKEIFNK